MFGLGKNAEMQAKNIIIEFALIPFIVFFCGEISLIKQSLRLASDTRLPIFPAG
jgi:hypothetical protein